MNNSLPLDIKTKIALVQYEVGAYALCMEGWESSTELPAPKPCPKNLFLSNLFDCDWKEDIYDNSAFTEKSKLVNTKEVFGEPNATWFIGDYIEDTFYYYCRDLAKNKQSANEDKVFELEHKLMTIMNQFNAALEKKLNPAYKYEECGNIAGETIYRRVEA